MDQKGAKGLGFQQEKPSPMEPYVVGLIQLSLGADWLHPVKPSSPSWVLISRCSDSPLAVPPCVLSAIQPQTHLLTADPTCLYTEREPGKKWQWFLGIQHHLGEPSLGYSLATESGLFNSI